MHNASRVNQDNIAKLVQHMVSLVHLVIFVRNQGKGYQHYAHQVHIIVVVALEILQNVAPVQLVTFVAMAVVLMASKQIGHKREHA